LAPGVTRLASANDEESNAVNPADEEGNSPTTENEEGNSDGDGGVNPGSQVRGRWLRHESRRQDHEYTGPHRR
jgi:hypothetical protein